jgi:hypothetical protein
MMEILYVVNSLVVRHNKVKASQKLFEECKHMKANDRSEVLLLAYDTKDSINGKKPIGAPRIQRLDSAIKKVGGSVIDWFNPCGN